jgi:hypothetical protein
MEAGSEAGILILVRGGPAARSAADFNVVTVRSEKDNSFMGGLSERTTTHPTSPIPTTRPESIGSSEVVDSSPNGS